MRLVNWLLNRLTRTDRIAESVADGRPVVVVKGVPYVLGEDGELTELR
jgi:hypothetical protein